MSEPGVLLPAGLARLDVELVARGFEAVHSGVTAMWALSDDERHVIVSCAVQRGDNPWVSVRWGGTGVAVGAVYAAAVAALVAGLPLTDDEWDGTCARVDEEPLREVVLRRADCPERVRSVVALSGGRAQ